MINTENISVVLQGPVTNETAKIIKDLRALMPHAEIILSTWDNESTDNCRCDIVVKTPQPEAFVQHDRLKVLNNINRLIRSTKEGIKVATKEYILKIRSDLHVDSLNFLKAYDFYPRDAGVKFVKHKLLVPALFSRMAYRKKPTPFHISDWAMFGLAEDVRAFFNDTPEVEEPEYTRWFKNKHRESPFGSTMFRFATEQYLTYSFYRRVRKLNLMNDAADNGSEVVSESNSFILSNFIIAEYLYTGWRLSKYPASTNEFRIGSDFFYLWNRRNYEVNYKILCDSTFIIKKTKEYDLYKNLRTSEARCRMQKHLGRLMESTTIKQFLEEFGAIFFTSLLYFKELLITKYEK